MAKTSFHPKALLPPSLLSVLLTASPCLQGSEPHGSTPGLAKQGASQAEAMARIEAAGSLAQSPEAVKRNRANRRKREQRKAKAAKAKAEPKASPVTEDKERKLSAPPVQKVRGWVIAPGHSLDGADFSGKNLRGINFTGVDVTGARFFHSEVFGAIGLDLRQAVHHGFYGNKSDPAGFVTTLDVCFEEGASRPRSLCVMDDGTLAFLLGDRNWLHTFTPTGQVNASVLSHENRLLSLTKAPSGKLRFLGDRSQGAIDLAQDKVRYLGDGKVCWEVNIHPHKGSSRPTGIHTDAAGRTWIFYPDRYSWAVPSGFKGTNCYFADPRMPGDRLALLWHDAEKRPAALMTTNELPEFALAVPGGEQEHYTLPGRPGCLALDRASRVWITLPDQGALLRLEWKAGRLGKEVLPLPKFQGRKADPRALAAGPDGSMWFTVTKGNWIGRVTPDDKVTPFPLPPATHPVELVLAPNGRMVFTMSDRPRLGAIQALDPKPTPDSERKEAAAASFEVEPYREKPSPARRTRAERLALAAARNATQAEYDPATAESPDAPEPLKPETEAGTAAPREERKERALPKAQVPVAPAPEAPASEAPARDPEAQLDLWNINLLSERTQHILDWHGEGLVPWKSQFAKDWSTAEGVTELVARFAEDIATTRVFDSWGRNLTRCHQPGVGRVHRYGVLEPTDYFEVVTVRWWNGEAMESDVRTAYPCR